MMRSVKFFFCLLITGLTLQFAHSQSLSQMIESVKTGLDDTVKVNTLSNICDSIVWSRPDEAREYALKALELARRLQFRKGEGFALKYIGITYFTKGEYVPAVNNFQQAMEVFESIGYKKGVANMQSNLGVIYNNEGDYAQALEQYLQAYKLSEEIRDSFRMVTTLNNIGLIYSKKSNTLDKAEEYYLKALHISEERGYEEVLGTVMVNLGEMQFMNGEYEEALKYFESALKILKKTNSNNIAYTVINIGKIYLKWKDFPNAIKYEEEALRSAQASDAKLETGMALTALANIYLEKGDYQKSIDFFSRAEKIALEIGAKEERKYIYDGKANAFLGMRDFASAYRYRVMESQLKDTLFSETSELQINQLQIQYKIASMLKENESLKNEARLRDVKNKLQMVAIGLLFLGIISVSIFLVLIVRANNQKKKVNEKLNQTNSELKSALDIVNQQKKQIETAHDEITASINYAQYIQSSVLPKHEQLEMCLGEYFVLHRPVEIVSGDFYWVARKGMKSIIVVADCTGHGVPGAFMSMLGISLLNEIIIKESVTNPADILNQLRNEVIGSLKQKGERWEQKDGMDISLCCIDRENMKLQFAGAINPLYLIRHRQENNPGLVHSESLEDAALVEFKGDSMPIGISDEMNSFSLREIDICKGDIFYLFTDGFPDQFGGSDHKKFSYRRFRESLLNTRNGSLSVQKVLLEQSLDGWMGNTSQTDDILVIGFRVS